MSRCTARRDASDGWPSSRIRDTSIHPLVATATSVQRRRCGTPRWCCTRTGDLDATVRQNRTNVLSRKCFTDDLGVPSAPIQPTAHNAIAAEQTRVCDALRDYHAASVLGV